MTTMLYLYERDLNIRKLSLITFKNYLKIISLNHQIAAFGLGMLRGMGWKEEEGIGKTKQKIDEFKTTVRPKGLGLGAIPVQKKKEKIKEESQQLQV